MSEQISYMVHGPNCRLDPYVNQNHAVFLPKWLPDPLEIVAVEWNTQAGPAPSGTNAMFMLLHDIGGRYCNETGYPPNELPTSNDPLCHMGLFRLVIRDMQQGSSRNQKNLFSPSIIYSRSRGDKIIVDVSGYVDTGGGNFGEYQFQPCWTLYFVKPDGWQAPGSIPSGPNDQVCGTWFNTPVGTGRSWGNGQSLRYAYFTFTPAITGDVAEVRVKTTPGTVGFIGNARITSDNARQPGNVIGMISAPREVSVTPGEVGFQFGGGIPVTAGTTYGVLLDSGTAPGMLVLETVNNLPGTTSKRGNTLNSLVDLPSSEDWRIRVVVV